MLKHLWWGPVTGLLACNLAVAADDNKATQLGEVVVTAPMMEQPLVVVTDPKAPRQPVPAHDGADILKSIPGFAVIRKGGTDGDPVFRGMAASRLNILLDGEQIMGGCGMRMDPPTAYIFPESYDRITVIKGPQSVLYGPGSSAGTVLFERDIKRFAQPGWKFNGSLTAGSFGRNDQVADVRAGTPDFYFQGTGTRSDSNDYKDGDGKSVHSAYTRWSTSAAVGWTPDNDTRLEVSGVRSDGQAAYADRTMDGVKFSRENVGLKFEKKNLSQLVEKIEAQAYYNYVDHVMDNYTLRSVASTAARMVNNPDRETIGGRAAITLRFNDATKATVGADYQSNVHTLRTGMGATADNYTSAARSEDANFRNYGLFGELTHYLAERDKVVAGLRADSWNAQDKRAATLSTKDAASLMYSYTNPTAGMSRDKTLTSGFARYEHDLAVMPTTLYAGLGHTERFPDYWELISANKESLTTHSAFDTKPEKTNQLDAGMVFNNGKLTASLSGFYSKIDDYIMVQSGVVKTYAAGNRTISVVRNVDATTWGGEAGLSYALTGTWKADATLAYVHGDNDTDGTPLAQLPPLEVRLGLSYDNKTWSTGALLRLVSEQDRFDRNKGNIVGQDIGRTPGFGVFSLNAGYRPKKGVLIAGGIDNLFDKTYAEHISRSGAMVTGFDQTIRVNEPGRNIWIKLNIALD
ncbi:copper transporter porin [Sulfurimicrobium lacus]|uniref:Copper transporter porin n=1 Tax=Sulfurimicrobium lacus TaxID=2715678 RepID=A0A6F8V7R2_9PROT|nr:TonB-dependent copper receptor [Sulfurimicrobium lacus]BCB25161.1 copper transporter porin [Sulfurimicrobium lacus]